MVFSEMLGFVEMSPTMILDFGSHISAELVETIQQNPKSLSGDMIWENLKR